MNGPGKRKKARLKKGGRRASGKKRAAKHALRGKKTKKKG